MGEQHYDAKSIAYYPESSDLDMSVHVGEGADPYLDPAYEIKRAERDDHVSSGDDSPTLAKNSDEAKEAEETIHDKNEE